MAGHAATGPRTVRRPDAPLSVLGVVALRLLQPNIAEMKRLYVRPEARGLGLGRLLAIAVIEHARQAGYEAICLDTLPQMTAAHELYRSLGFSERDAYYQNPHGALYLELSLSSSHPFEAAKHT
jgi:ribosomal protein S18 acetylase RimI-like enzyme